MPEIDRITEWTLKYMDGTINPQELAGLNEWLAKGDNRQRFKARTTKKSILAAFSRLEEAAKLREADLAAITYPSDTIYEPVTSVLSLRPFRWRVYIGVAALFICIASGLVLYLTRPIKEPVSQGTVVSQRFDVAPGKDRATLTLGDGSVILLDSAKNGTIAQQGASQIVKVGSGQLTYQASAKTTATSFNTVSTPAGGRYRVQLPDGSSVWLNAASSVHFPTAFSGSSRDIEMTGEAYFEVAKNPLKPFRVKAGNVYVSVLGTHFNIRAYTDEPSMQTTLLEGSVKISEGADHALLVPGDQALISNRIRVAHDVDTDEAVAWKNGVFSFNHADIQTVMREVARWYRMDVRYEGEVTNRRITADVGRDKYLSNVLQILEASGYHFNVSDGKTIVVLP